MILVTGGAGYIGSHTLLSLEDEGRDYLVVDNLSVGHRRAVPAERLVELDLTDRAGLTKLIDSHPIEGIVHFAALSLVGRSVTDPRTYFDNNIIGGLNLFGLAAERNLPVVFSSSCAVYGAPENLPLREDHPRRPITPYGWTKLILEQTLEEYGRAYGLSWVSLRYFNAAGADPQGRTGEDHRPESHLIPLILQAAKPDGDGRVTVYGNDYPTRDGTAIRDYVHVSDLAQAHLKALDLARRGGAAEALNLGLGRGRTVLEVIDACRRVTGRDIEIVDADRRPGDPAELTADPGAARQRLGWEPVYTDLDEMVATAWNWHSGREDEGK